MPITGTQPALTEARVGMMRVGGSRVGYVLPIPYVTVNGVVRTNNVRIAGCSVRDTLNGIPNTATFRVDGFTPTEGHEVVFNFGTHGPTQFRGRILSTTKIYETDNPANLAWDCSCISEEWLLNKTKVTRRYQSTSATAIILDLVVTYAPWLSTRVESGLPDLDEITFTHEDLTDCFDRICQRIGEDWKLDYAKVLHVPAADGLTANAITDSDDHGMSGIAVTTDLSQVRTQQSGEGGGSNASVDVAVGQPTIPVDEGHWYNAAGGVVKSGPQFIAYTGKSAVAGTGTTVAGTPLSPGTLTAAMVAGTSGNLSPGAYQYKTAFVTPLGESEVSGASSAATITTLSAPGALTAAAASGTSGNLLPGAYLYKVTYATAAGETTAGTASASASITNLSAPGALTATTVSETAGNLSVGAYTYKVTYVTAAGETDAGSASSTASVAAVPDANVAPSVAATTGGSLTDQVWYSYKVAFTTALGETIAWQQSASVQMTGGNNAVSLTSIPVSSDDRVTGRKLYRHGQGVGVVHDWALVATIANNSGTTHTDTMADASVGVPPQGVNTASSGRIDLTSIPTSGDARVTARRLYRTLANGSAYKFLTTISGNVTTTYSDNTADSGLGADAPTVNTSGSGQMSLTTIPTSADARVTKRRIYRTEVGGSVYKLVTTLNDNSTTTYTDNTRDSSLGIEPPTVDDASSGQLSLTVIPVGPAGTTARTIYRTEAGGSVYKALATIAGNVTTTYTDNIADTRLGEAAPTASHVGAAAGATTLRVADTGVVDAAGGWAHVDSQVIRFTGRSVASGEGTLTGIPASGAGSIVASITAGSAVINAPFLSGVTGILYAIPQGEQVNIWVTRNDTAAQAFMAAALTTATYTHDGIIEADPIQDLRMSETEITARCDAKLEELTPPLVTVRYVTPDFTAVSGRDVTVNLGAPTNISGTFKIQSVTTTGFSSTGAYRPVRQVECSSRMLTFEQILRIRRAV